MSSVQPPNPEQPIDPNGAFSNPVPPPPGSGASPVPPRPAQGPVFQGFAPGAMPPGGIPPMPPMPFYPAPQPPAPRPRHSFTRGILVTLAVTIFSISLMLNLYLLLLGGILSGGAGGRTTTVTAGDPTKRVVVVPITGTIMDREYEKFDRMMKQVEKDVTCKALVIEIDSPGGSVTASDQIYHRIQKYKAEHPNIPVVTSMAGLAASGGYYAACPTDYIFAQPTTITGSIGVLMPSYNASDLMKKIGVTDRTITSSGAPFKDAGSPLKPELPEHRKYYQDLIDQMFTQFKEVVATGRKDRLKAPMDEIANGKAYTSADALKLGLIDKIGYLDDATAHAAQSAGLSNPTIVKYQETPSLSELLLGAEGKSSVPDRGITFHISPEALDRMSTPRVMYLWRGE